MTQYFSIHEYGVLLRGGEANDLNAVSLLSSDWDWLLQHGVDLVADGSALFRPAIKKGKQVLQILNYVGILSLPSGKIIEILPKIADDRQKSRKQLLKMICKVNNLPFVHFNDANLKVFDQCLSEMLIGKFLEDVQHLLKRGIRSQYIPVKNCEHFLKGKLMVSEHLRQPPQKRCFFPVEYDDYILARPENMLLRWAVDQVYHWSQNNLHRSHARKLITMLSDIPKSINPAEDFKKWKDDRLMQHYAQIKSWIELIIRKQSPITQAGDVKGISMLFPMEQLFEKYVYRVIKEHITSGYFIHSQFYAGWLANHKGQKLFKMKPDLVIQRENDRVGIADTKWKALDQMSFDTKYNISQADMYQLFAYGQKCLEKGGSLFLIYPRSKNFDKPLPSFDFGVLHKLWAIPFCLETDTLVLGEWVKDADYLKGCSS